MTPDKKVEEYLVRARTLIRTKLVGIDWETPEHALLVAQMIQLEDHNKPEISVIDKPLLEQIKLSRE